MNQAITFQYTFEEFSEGVTAIQKSTRQLLTPKMGAGGFIWMLAFLVAFVVMMMFAVPYGRGAAPATGDPAPATAANRAMSYVAPALPWVMILSFAFFFFRRVMKHQRRVLWEADPAIHRPRTITPYAEGLGVSDPFSQTHIQWQGFVGFEETRNLFLLYIGRFTAYFIPKRAFPGQAEVEQFRALCQHSVSCAQMGFPVLPAAPAARPQMPPPLPK